MSTATKTSTPASGKSPLARKRWGWLAAAAVALVAIAGAWYYHAKAGASVGHSEAAHGAAAADGGAGSGSDEAVAVETTRISPGGIVRTSSQIGSIQAYEEADLYAKVSGYLKTQNVDYGSRVKRGQLLAEIDDPEVVKEEERTAAAVIQAKAAVQQAKARIESTQAELKAALAIVEQSKAEIQRALAKRRYREKVLVRFKDLVARQAETQQVVDEQEENLEAAKADEFAAKAAEATAKAQASTAKAKIEGAKADLTEAEANVKVDEASLAKARVLVEYTRITSPYDGVITRRNFFPGAFIRSASEGNATPLLSVARTDKVRVVTLIPDRDVPLTNVGDDAEVTLDALAPEVFKGKVSRFADSEDITSRTMHTEIDLPNPKDRIRPGMYGIAKVLLDYSTKRNTLPANCLVGEQRGDQADVYIIKNGKVSKQRIRIGDDDGVRLEVLEGLGPDDEVILSTGIVTEGMPVRSVAKGKSA